MTESLLQADLLRFVSFTVGAFFSAVVMVQQLNKVEQVGIIEGPVYESGESSQVGRAVMQDEVMRGIIHPFQQFNGFPDDGGSVSPGEDGSKQSGDLNILSFGISVRDGDGIPFNKGGLIVVPNPFFEQ